MSNSTNQLRHEQPSSDLEAAANWSRSEHVTPAVEVQAQKLLSEAGSPELAKYAVESAAQTADSNVAQSSDSNNNTVSNTGSYDHFAQLLGFHSRAELLEASSTLTTKNGESWWITFDKHNWVAWKETALDSAQIFTLLAEAKDFILTREP